MRNLKKFLALVLATLMVVSAAATVSAYAVFDDVEDDNQYAEAIGKLVEYNITNGIGDGMFGVDNEVERYQMALFMARALNPNETDWQSGMAIFDDVEEWYGAIAYAYMNGIVTGIGNNQFAPHNGIRYQDALIMALRALGYKVDTTGDPYWLAAYQKAAEIGLTDNVAVTKGDKTLTRAETAQVICNMLSATPADGSATIEEKNFGVAGVNNVTTFVITATPNQSYADGAKANDKDYVGIQPLVNGIPTGNITYLPAEMLGIDAADVDNYFNYSVGLVNYDAETGLFDNAIICNEPDVVYSTNTSVSGSKLTINGAAYYPSTEITGAALKNEIVVYAGGKAANQSRILLKDADGDIIDTEGKKIAIFAYTSPNGTKYYADTLNNKVISETVALKNFGVVVDGSYTEYATLSASELGTNYQLTLFDDDDNGIYDRAIKTPVYMSVYNNPDGAKVNITSNAFASSTENVKFSEKLTKGDVFVYTYNQQLNKVNVIEVLEVKTGVIENLNLTNYKDQSDNTKDYLAVITIDGVNYKIGNTYQESYMGATLCATGTAPTSVADIADNARIAYKNSNTTLENILYFANIDSPIKFIAYNGYLIFAETFKLEDAFKYMVVVDAVDFDDEGIYVDAYVDGVRDVYHITQYKDSNDKTIAFADLSVFKRTAELTAFYNSAATNVYKTVEIADGSYKVSVQFDKVCNDQFKKSDGTYVCDWDKEFKLFQASNDGLYVFDDGITNKVDTKGSRLRTDASTKFYFINTTTGGVSLYTGKVADKFSINTANGVTIFTDKVGYGDISGKNGVAKILIVYYNNSNKGDIEGFNLSAIANGIVYIANPGTFTVDSAANFGLEGVSGTYYKYGNVAINMADGTVLSNIYSEKPLTAGVYKEIDGNNIVTDIQDASKIQTRSITSVDLKDQYITVAPICDALNGNDKVTKIVTVGADNLTVYTNGKYKLNGSERTIAVGTSVAYLNNDIADGVIVLVVGSIAPSTTRVTAKWTWNNSLTDVFAGIATNVATSSAKVSGKVYLASSSATASTPIGFDYYQQPIVVNGKFDISAGNITSAVIKKNGASANETNIKVTTSMSDNVVSFAFEKTTTIDDWGDATTHTFAAGKYVVTITLDFNGTPATFEIPVTVA